MSIISQIQRKRIFNEITRTLYASGERPRLIDTLKEVSEYFAEYPAGLPLPSMVQHIEFGMPSNVDRFNQMLAHVVTNISVTYEAATQHNQQMLDLTTTLRSSLDMLKARRKRLVSQVDDYLFSLYNVDGYYYSASDNFSDLSFTDLSLTSAFIDAYSGKVSLPAISSLTKRVTPESITGVSTDIVVDGKSVQYENISPFSGCIDGLSNTVWSSEVELSQPSEVIAHIAISISNPDETVQISKIEFDPYCVSPVQVWVEAEARQSNSQGDSVITDFGGEIKTSYHKMVFIDQPQVIRRVHLWIRKTEHDYTISDGGSIKYRYIFGAKDIIMTEHVYDNQATLVSTPLSLPAELQDDDVIDAVSLVAVDETPIDTNIIYYVAPDVSTPNPQLSDFTWQQIEKLDNDNPDKGSIVRFDGALKYVQDIRLTPRPGDLQLKPITTTGPLVDQNPNPEIIPTQDIYRLCDFGEGVIPSSLVLEEGVNTIRIRHIDPEPGVSADEALTLDYWSKYVNGSNNNFDIVYGQTDIGHGFFSGGDVGEHGKWVYLETYLESNTSQETVLKKIIKPDTNSRVWAVKVFLNGREVGDLPIGVNELMIPWSFNKGLNHIAMTIVIPTSTSAYPNPQMGTINLLGDALLGDFGTVKLSTWSYVDFFKMKYNEIDEPYTFTMYDGEIISRRKPTDNFRIKYAKARSSAPDAIRLRADLSRSIDNQYVSPQLDTYRLRFIYS